MSDIEIEDLARISLYPHPFTGEKDVYITDNEFMYYEEVLEHLMEHGHDGESIPEGKRIPKLGHPQYQIALLTEYSEVDERAVRQYLVAKERLESGSLHEFDPDTLEQDLELCDAVLPLDITYRVDDICREVMVDPGRYSGPWENCYPAEYDEVDAGDEVVVAETKINVSEYSGDQDLKALMVSIGEIIESEAQVCVIPNPCSDYDDDSIPEPETAGRGLPYYWGRHLKEIMMLHSPEVKAHVVSDSKRANAQERVHEKVREQLLTSIGEVNKKDSKPPELNA